MDLTEAILAASLIVNVLFIVGIPGTLFVRFILRRMKTWVIGLNGPPTIRLMTVRGSRITLNDGGKKGDLEIDPTLSPVSTDGMPVVFYDRKTIQQIAPDDGRDAQVPNGSAGTYVEDVQADGRTVRQLKPYDGNCINDGDELVIKKRDGVHVNIGTNWRRIDGRFLNEKRRGHNVADLVGEPDGMWEALGKAMPFMMIVALFMIGGLFFTVAGLS